VVIAPCELNAAIGGSKVRVAAANTVQAAVEAAILTNGAG